MQRVNLRQYFFRETNFSLSEISILELIADGSGYWLLAGASAQGAVNRIYLSQGNAIEVLSVSWDLTQVLSTRLVNGMSTVLDGKTYLLSLESLTGNIMLQQLDNAANPQTTVALQTVSGQSVRATQIEIITVAGHDYLVAANMVSSGLSLYQIQSDFQLQQVSTLADTDKSNAIGISDLQTVRIGNSSYIVSISATENGMSSYLVNPDGSLQFIDSINSKSGLWLAGLSAMLQIEHDGQTYLISTASHSGTLAAVRLNPFGVFFITDMVNDSRDTRFSGASALDSFAVGDRDFIVVGGNDGGLSLFELMPEGRLFHHQNMIQTADWNIGPIQELRSVVLGDEVQIIVSGTGRAGLVQLVLPLDNLGDHRMGTSGADQITGGAGDDVLFGLENNDQLFGGAGDDILFAGTGSDRLTGGSGADVFVFTADGQPDQITDFEFGIDRLHLGDWGRIYDISSLQINARSSGATIRWQNEVIEITTASSNAIQIADWSIDDFIF